MSTKKVRKLASCSIAIAISLLTMVTYNATEFKMVYGDDESSRILKEQSGICGPNLRWNISKSGELHIFGKGNMYDYCEGFSAFYIHTAPWKDFKVSSVVIEEGVTSIGSGAFLNSWGLEKIEIARTVSVIGWNAFANCDVLGEIEIPNNVEVLEEATFQNCDKLKRIKLPSKLKSIENFVFDGCSSLEKLVFPKTLKNLGGASLNYCKNLRSIKFLGDPPKLNPLLNTACGSKIVAYYPKGNKSWTEKVRINFGSSFSWQIY